MQFTTQVPISAQHPAMDYSSGIVSLGSCFAVNIAEKFGYFQFRSSLNPFGILFSPEAIRKAVGFAAEGKSFGEPDIFFHNERWHCFDAHSGLSGAKEDVLLALNAAAGNLRDGLASASHIIITLGTAWIYRKNDTGQTVANCHKMPQRGFTKELLSPDAVSHRVADAISTIRMLNKEAAILFTVSPVRHIKDGFIENQRSKANLISGLHAAISGVGNASYFPSYEIMMDELRDYRFYADDLLHPSPMAIDYIWERFADAWISPGARPVMAEVDAIQKALAHRPFDPKSEGHRAFAESTRRRIAELQERFPFVFAGQRFP